MIGSRASRKMLAVGLLASALCLAYTLILSPILGSVEDDGDSIQASLAEIARYHAIIASIPVMRRRIEALKLTIPTDRLIAPAAPTTIESDFQGRLREMISSSGAAPLDSRTLNPTSEGDFTKYGVEVQLRASVPEIAKLLKWIDAARPGVFVDRLSLQGAENGDGPVDGAGQRQISVDITMAAYAANPNSPPKR